MKAHTDEMTYHIYVTDCLRMITENTANVNGGHYIKDRYYDQINPEIQKTKNTKQSGKEIADNIIGGLTGKGGNKS